jgi:hypothetical protein
MAAANPVPPIPEPDPIIIDSAMILRLSLRRGPRNRIFSVVYRDVQY